ncbi:MAG: DUF3300 domain-containing protein [Gammaproteobacteria bacterium]|nr:DUF3300 domain-containing protein [Gammaproteobacteria bacterium]
MIRNATNLMLALALGSATSINAAAQVTTVVPVTEQVAVDSAWFAPHELDQLVGPVALYPDDLLALVFAAAQDPVAIVQARRFLEARKANPDLEPNETWSDATIALLNYPDVVEMLDDDLDWTADLGRAVVEQEADVMAAVQRFRTLAYDTGNLRSDDKLLVNRQDEIIEVRPVSQEVIYVPRYEPSRVIVYNTAPAFDYWPVAYPSYYFGYSPGHQFYFGVWSPITYFTLGWTSHRLYSRPHRYISADYRWSYRWRDGHVSYNRPRGDWDRHDRYRSSNRPNSAWRNGDRGQVTYRSGQQPRTAGTDRLRRENYRDDRQRHGAQSDRPHGENYGDRTRFQASRNEAQRPSQSGRSNGYGRRNDAGNSRAATAPAPSTSSATQAAPAQRREASTPARTAPPRGRENTGGSYYGRDGGNRDRVATTGRDERGYGQRRDAQRSDAIRGQTRQDVIRQQQRTDRQAYAGPSRPEARQRGGNNSAAVTARPQRSGNQGDNQGGFRSRRDSGDGGRRFDERGATVRR